MPNFPADQLTDAELKREQRRVVRNSVAAVFSAARYSQAHTSCCLTLNSPSI